MPLQTIPDVMSALWDRKLPVDIEGIAKRAVLPLSSGDMVTVRVEQSDNNGNSLVMRFVPSEGGCPDAVILSVNAQEIVERQRFAIAHGLSRILIARAFEDLNVTLWDFNPTIKDTDRYFANQMAFDWLLPMTVLRLYVQKHTNIAEISSAFQVSPTTLRRQLQRNGILPRRA